MNNTAILIVIVLLVFIYACYKQDMENFRMHRYRCPYGGCRCRGNCPYRRHRDYYRYRPWYWYDYVTPWSWYYYYRPPYDYSQVSPVVASTSS